MCLAGCCRVCLCMCVCVCMHVCMHACVCASIAPMDDQVCAHDSVNKVYPLVRLRTHSQFYMRQYHTHPRGRVCCRYDSKTILKIGVLTHVVRKLLNSLVIARLLACAVRWRVKGGVCVYVCICMYVYVCVCMYVCMYVCHLKLADPTIMTLSRLRLRLGLPEGLVSGRLAT